MKRHPVVLTVSFLLILAFGPKCSPPSVESYDTGDGDVVLADVTCPTCLPDAEGIAEIDREIPCDELMSADVNDGRRCQMRSVLGGARKSFNATLRSLNVLACQGEFEMGDSAVAALDLGNCSNPTPNGSLVEWSCQDAIEISIDRSDGSTHETLLDAECGLQTTGINCRQTSVSDKLCGLDIEDVVMILDFLRPVVDPDDPANWPPNPLPQTIGTGFLFRSPDLQTIVEGQLNSEVGGGRVVSRLECEEGGARFTCGSEKGTTTLGVTTDGQLGAMITEAFPPNTLFTATARLDLDPGPINIKVSQTIPGDSPAGPMALPDLNLMLLPNTAILPHIPFGEAGPLLITTQIIVSNPHNEAVDGELNLFDTSTGLPLEVTLAGETRARHEFSVDALGSQLFELDPTGIDPPQIAWAFVQASRELTAAADFITLDPTGPVQLERARPLQLQGAVVAEAGIAASGVGLTHVLHVSSNGRSVDTAFAIVNPTTATANAVIRLKTDGAQGPETPPEITLEIAPHQQVARFFGQFFGLAPGAFEGTLEIRSDSALAVFSLRTLSGMQSASLPSASR